MRNPTYLFLVILLFVLSFFLKREVPVTPVHVVSVSEAPVLQVHAERVDETDTLRKLYTPPLRYNDVEFRQVGYLTSDGIRLPLFGRKIDRNRWTYYTMQDGIKLPIEYNRRVCTQFPGCEEMSDKDETLVDGITFKVHLYDVQIWGY